MKPNELRIGNWVSHEDYSTEMFRVEAIHCGIINNYIVHTIGGKNGEWINPIDLIRPIPLTEELLLKCRFESREYGVTIRGYYYYKKPISIYSIKDGVEAEVSLCDDTINLSKNSPQYLHQLQNLYFVITGEELEINL